MVYCYVEFVPKDQSSLERLRAFVELVKQTKADNRPIDSPEIIEYLSSEERSYFWNPSPDEMAEWNNEWFSTPLPKRHSPEMILPQWDFESMLDAFANGEYELVGVLQESLRHFIAFNPYAYPYGGAQAFVALAECFGHRVIGVEDGTGYAQHVPRKIWKPRGSHDRSGT